MKSASEKGLEFVDESSVPDVCKCPICFGCLNSPFTVPCCHKSFCASCIERVLEMNHICPFCREPLTTDLLQEPDRTLKNMLKDVHVFCSNKPLCDWRGPAGNLEEHLGRTCQQAIQACRYASRGCSKVLPKHELEKHCSNECCFRDGEVFTKTSEAAQLRAELEVLRKRVSVLERNNRQFRLFFYTCFVVLLAVLLMFRPRIRWD